MSVEFYWVAVALAIILSSARLTRLATWDEFPPAQWLRNKYADFTDTPNRQKWQLLAFCGYCASFWITGLVMLAAWLCGVFDGPESTGEVWARVWWAVTGVFGLSYVAAIVMAHDGDEGEDD